MNKFRPDVVHCGAFFPYVAVRVASILCPKKMSFVLTFHVTQPFDRKEDRWNHIFSRFARAFRDRFIAIHSSQIDFYSTRYGLPKDRFTVIHNGVDTGYFSNQLNIKKNSVFRIVHVASLKPLKDQWTLLNSVVELEKYYENWELLIAGADQLGLQSAYFDYVVKHNIAQKVRFLGTVSNTRDVLRDSDVFVLTSITEALPISVIEAISMNLPCIVTAVGGNSDLISHGKEGFLVAPGDYRAIAKYLNLLARNPSKRREMAIAARQKAVTGFDFENMMNRYRVLFDKLMSN
jgi:glycosyltransferase involved in cell wall biosynthesis